MDKRIAMNKVFSILQCVFFLALSALVSCNPMECEDDVPYFKGTKRGEYKIEVSISGDIEGLSLQYYSGGIITK